MPRNMGIYKVQNLQNGKFYLGSSNNLAKRRREHFWALMHNKHTNPYLQNAFNKHGKGNFRFIVLEHVRDEDRLREIEQRYLDRYNACDRDVGYNINEYADGGGLFGESNPNYGKPMSEEQKRKISRTLMGHPVSLETRRKMSEARKGKYGGKKHPLYGKPVSHEKRMRQSKLMKDRYTGERNPFYGKTHSKKTREKMSKAKRGKTGKLCPNSIEIVQLTLDGNFVSKHDAMRAAQRETGIWASNIQKCCVGQLKQTGGYRWMYYEDYSNLI